MDRYEHPGRWASANRAAERRLVAFAAGDRAAAVMAASARWDGSGRARITAGPRRQSGPIRRLGVWLVKLGVRLQGLPGEVARGDARSTEATAS